MKLVVFQAYRVQTSKRVLDVMFRGQAKNGNRLWFTELDPPYGDVFLRPRHIIAIQEIGAQR